MSLLLRNAEGTLDVKIEISELVNIKGAIFVVNQLCVQPPSIKLQPANASQIKQYLSINQIPETVPAPIPEEPDLTEEAPVEPVTMPETEEKPKPKKRGRRSRK
jgi:hypothetical protein